MVYDICYIGGGLNYAGAIIASKKGKKVALIENKLDELGGVCLHKGCIPSKMFLHYSNEILQSKNKVFDGNLSLKMDILQQKKEALLQNATKAIKFQCKDIDLIEGEGKIVAPNRVEVDGKIIEAKYIVIGTGSHPFIPEGIEYDKESIIVSDEVLNLKELPKSIAIYGSGAIGLEMSSFFASCGVDTTLIYRGDTILKKAHPKLSLAIGKMLDSIGVKRLSSHAIKSAKSNSNRVETVFEDGSSINTQKLLVATGRRANVDVIACKDIEIDKRGIITNDWFETNLKNHFAIGDCNGKLQLAHAARAEVLNVTKKILNEDVEKIDLDSVVKFIHTLPMSYATVGKTKYSLEKDKIPYKESFISYIEYPYAYYNDAKDGAVVIYADEDGFILGAEILSPHAEELIAIVAMAIATESDANLAKRTILAHPTFSEAIEKGFYRL